MRTKAFTCAHNIVDVLLFCEKSVMSKLIVLLPELIKQKNLTIKRRNDKFI